MELFSYLDEDGILYIGGNSNSDDFAPFGPLQNDDGLMLKLGDFANIQEGLTYGGSSTDEFFSMCVTDGEKYSFGTSYSTDGDVNNDIQEADAWLQIPDSEGEKLWSSHFGTEENDWIETVIPLSDRGVLGSRIYGREPWT